MRAVVQRVATACVAVDGKTVGAIGRGLAVLIGVGPKDTEQDCRYIVDKVVHLRIFPDEAGKMNLSVQDIGGELLLVSQFTLYGDCRKGRRPSFEAAGSPEAANTLYNQLVSMCRATGLAVETGQFQADMKVTLCNEGPVTLLLDSERTF